MPPPSDVHERLGAAHTSALDGVFREVLSEKMELLGTWATLGALIKGGHLWPRQLVEKYWPRDAAMEIEAALALDIGDESIHRRASLAATRLPVDSTVVRKLATRFRRDSFCRNAIHRGFPCFCRRVHDVSMQQCLPTCSESGRRCGIPRLVTSAERRIAVAKRLNLSFVSEGHPAPFDRVANRFQ
jgi:hypothetical protein